jgi:hypothetical protein
MGDVGESLNTLFDTEASALASAVHEAVERTVALQNGVAILTEGSEHPGVESLQRRLARIHLTLGDLLVEIGVTIEDKDTLLTAWGMPVAPSTTAQPAREHAPPAHPLLAEHMQRLFSAKLDLSELWPTGTARASLLASHGIYSLRDVFVAGKAHINDIKGLGTVTTLPLIELADGKIPGLHLKESPTPTDIATFCPTLRDVSWAALRHTVDYGTALQLRLGERHISVDDVLSKTPEELFGSQFDPNKLLHQSLYNRLLRDARLFAKEFEAAQRALHRAMPGTSGAS